MEGQLLVAEFAVRCLSTSAIVLVVVLAIGRFGPVIGGALAGLPMVLAPGLAFLLLENDARFVEQVATASLASLAGTQIFIGVYAALSHKGPTVAVAGAATAWILLVLVLARFPAPPYLAAGLFVVATLAARRVTGRERAGIVPPTTPSRLSMLVMRALAAGLLVGIATLAARLTGPAAGGILLAFPIGFSMIAVSVQSRFGRAVAVETAHAALLGMASLAVFAFAMTQALPLVSPIAAFSLALAAALTVTAALAMAVPRAARN